jgi:predicted transposase/invertase (TIGR01784 family)
MEQQRFSPEEAEQYEDSLKIYRDLKNSLDTAREEGREEGLEQGREEGKAEDAINMLNDGLPMEKVCKYTGLTEAKVKQLQKQLKTDKVS